jgi:hypothetical protein
MQHLSRCLILFSGSLPVDVCLLWVNKCSPLLVTNVKKEITSLWPNSNICLHVFISVVVTFIMHLLNAFFALVTNKGEHLFTQSKHTSTGREPE